MFFGNNYFNIVAGDVSLRKSAGMSIYTNNLIVEPVNSDDANGKAKLIKDLDSSIADLESGGPSNQWDIAHEVKYSCDEVKFAEPLIEDIYRFENPAYDNELEADGSVCDRNNDYDPDWPFPVDEQGKPRKSIWHLAEEFSELKKARETVKDSKGTVRIAHFDTGYDPAHITYSDMAIRHDLERNFVEDELLGRAADNYSKGFLNQPGHGSGTLGILAGTRVNIPEYNFDDSIGVMGGFEVVPIRLSRSVILFRNASFVKAVDYIISLYDDPATRCHVITMSMGGLPSKAWADAVNRAYEKGIFIVSAAGNNFGRATPRTLIYPARFNRVVAACGVTFDKSPYYKPFDPLHPFKGMQGNFGPRRFMGTAIAAFTPNMPWAKIGCRDVISLAGAGTSSATPQVAAAAAIYYRKYFDELEKLPEGWMKVEAIRNALFSSAKKEIKPADSDIELYFGNGILQACKMLEIAPHAKKMIKAEKDKVSWPLLKTILELKPFSAFEEGIEEQTMEMFELEILQLIQKNRELQEITGDEETPIEDLPVEKKKQVFDFIKNSPDASETLKRYLESIEKKGPDEPDEPEFTSNVQKIKEDMNMNLTLNPEDIDNYRWTTRHSQLNDVLAGLVPMPLNMEYFVKKAGIDPAAVTWGGNAYDIWQSIIQNAIHSGKVNNLIVSAMDRFKGNPYLKTALKKEEIFYSMGPKIGQDLDWHEPDEQTLEVLTMQDVNTLLPISFLETGLLRARSVAKVQRYEYGIRKVGTGFLVAGNIFVTNHHVIPDQETADKTTIVFNYEEDQNGIAKPNTSFQLDSSGFATSGQKEYDYTAIRIKGDANKDFGFLELNSAAVLEKDFVNIIQHPCRRFQKNSLVS